MASAPFFITGTDTEVGKTFFTASLIGALQAAGKTVSAFKPVAAGCEIVDGLPRNDDALTLIAALDDKPDYERVNPFALKQPIAPHIAAIQEGVELSVEAVAKACPVNKVTSDFCLVEGAGGWLVPLNAAETFADYARFENCEVILVVGMKLGCINHAMLTQAAINAAGLNLIGWVANFIDPNMQVQKENLATLKSSLKCPLIAEIPYLTGDNAIESASRCVKLEALLS
ncbi:dethiobiotin synthase [Aliikangiella marina]|uniref:ATP-dependent dethiobiotin synthetase BioD n=1 Tax=Aliikangiella marina TaxID=1712262 RepID=A0A545T6V1_9GAMM|nr:dethiobiotin synthase [Aliikangiella marina]TQV72951.1 dethiobiotin synthase [Aliikangiella marina]